MLSCLCSPCLGSKGRKSLDVTRSRGQSAQASTAPASAPAAQAAVTGGEAHGVATVSGSSDTVAAADAAAATTAATIVAASALAPSAHGASSTTTATTATVYVPLCSPFTTAQSFAGASSSAPPASQTLGSSPPRKLAPGPAPAPGHHHPPASAISTSADSRSATSSASCVPLPPLLYNNPQFASTFSSNTDRPTQFQSQSQSHLMQQAPGTATTATGSTATITPGGALPPPLPATSASPFLPGHHHHLFILQQATSSCQSAAGGATGNNTGTGTATGSNTHTTGTGTGTAPSLPTLSANAPLHHHHHPTNTNNTNNNNNTTYYNNFQHHNSNALYVGQLSTAASSTVRSAAGGGGGATEATARLMPAGGGGFAGDTFAALPPTVLLVSDASTTRLVEYLTHDSVDTAVTASTPAAVGAAAAAATAAGNSSSAAGKSPGTAGVGVAVSAVSAASAGSGSRRFGPLRSAASGASPGAGTVASSGFSLFGALQAFVEKQQHQGEAVATASATPQSASSPAGPSGYQAPGTLGDAGFFRGFDRGGAAVDSQDAPTATLSRVRSATHGSAADGGRNRRRMGGWGDGGGGLPHSPLGPGSDSRNGGGGQARGASQYDNGNSNVARGRSSSEWAHAPASGGWADSGAHADGGALAAGIIIGGGGYLATHSSGCEVTSGAAAMTTAAAAADRPPPPSDMAARGFARGSAATGDYYDGASAVGYSRPLSGPHSFDGMASLLSGNTAHFLQDSYRGGGGLTGSAAGGDAGSEADSRTENALSRGGAAAATPFGGGGGKSGGGGVRMQRTAERREFLAAARSISAVLQDVQILSVLGAGAHGKVYKGALRDRFVAVKVITHDVDLSASSVIPPTSLNGIHHVPSHASLAAFALGSTAAGGCGGAAGLAADASLGSSSAAAAVAEPPPTLLVAGGAAGGRRGTSGSGAKPAVHLLRFQRAGSSNLHALPAALSGGGGAGGAGGGSQASVATSAATAAALPVLSLPGMPPVVLPHKHMLEGLISASAQHPNITETYRIVTQLLSAPSMPAFVVTRGSTSPLWETTNLNPAAVLRFGNGSGSGGGGGNGGGTQQQQQRPSAERLARRAASPGSRPAGGSGIRERLQRASSLGRNSREGGRLRRLPSSPLAQGGLSNGGPSGGNEPASGSVPGPAGAGAAAGGQGAALRPCPASGASNGKTADAATAHGNTAAGGGSGVAEALPPAPAVATAAIAGSASVATAAAAATTADGFQPPEDRHRDSIILSTDGGGGVSTGPASISNAGGAATFRETSTLSVSALVRDVVILSSDRVSAGGGGGGSQILASGAADAAAAAPTSTGSSGRVRRAAAVALSGGGGSSILSTGAAILSASALAQASGEELNGQAAAAVVAEAEAGLTAAVRDRDANGGGSPSRPPQAANVVTPAAPEGAGAWHVRGSTGPGLGLPGLQELSGGGSQAGDPDSAELILDLLGAQAAAQRTASFLKRRQTREQQPLGSLDGGGSRGGSGPAEPASPVAAAAGGGGNGAAARPAVPDTAPWCLSFEEDDGGGGGGGRSEAAAAEGGIVGQLRRGATAARRQQAATTGRPPRPQVGAASEVASGGSGRSGGGGDGLDSPSGDLQTANTYDYMVADDSGQIPNENFGLATALFSTFRNSTYYGAPTEYGSLSGKPPPYRLQYIRGSHSSASAGGAAGGAAASGDGSGARLVPPAAAAGWAQAGSSGQQPSAPGREAEGGPLGPQVDSAGSISSAPYGEASLALPAPLQGAAAAAAASNGVHVSGGGAAASATWLPTIDELTAGVTADPPPPPQLPGASLLAARSSTGSVARNSLQRTTSLGSGENGTGGAGAASGGVATAGANRTSAGSAASGAAASSTQRMLLGSNATSNYGGQLMPADVQYDKLSWSNHTHTSASTSAVMLNSGFTALLSSLNMTGGGSNPGGGGGNAGGGGAGLINAASGVSGGGGWRRGDSTGFGTLSKRATTHISHTASGVTEASTTTVTNAANANLAGGGGGGDPLTGGLTASASVVGSAGTGADADGRGASRGGAAGGASAAVEHRAGALALMEPGAGLSHSFTDPRSSRAAAAAGARRRAAAAAAARATPGRERWQVLIVQELCTRGNLRDAIVGGAFHASCPTEGTQVIAMGQLLDTAAEIASAMAYLHSRAIVHGDLKTANVLLQRHDTDPRGFIAKLADFGLARQLGSRGVEDGLLVSRIGTVTHMAPETIRDNMMLLASDVYSFGVIMWELYCAQQPFANYSAFQLLSAVVQYDERPQFPVHCPPSYASLAVRCMAKNPRDRPTFGEVHKELIAIRDGLFNGGGGGGGGGGSEGPGRGSAGPGPGGVGPHGTITVPLAQARSEATRVLQSHLQIAVSGPTGGSGSGHGSGSLLLGGGGRQGQGGSEHASIEGAARDRDGGGGGSVPGGGGDATSPPSRESSVESWDVYSRSERRGGMTRRLKRVC